MATEARVTCPFTEDLEAGAAVVGDDGFCCFCFIAETVYSRAPSLKGPTYRYPAPDRKRRAARDLLDIPEAIAAARRVGRVFLELSREWL